MIHSSHMELMTHLVHGTHGDETWPSLAISHLLESNAGPSVLLPSLVEILFSQLPFRPLPKGFPSGLTLASRLLPCLLPIDLGHHSQLGAALVGLVKICGAVLNLKDVQEEAGSGEAALALIAALVRAIDQGRGAAPFAALPLPSPSLLEAWLDHPSCFVKRAAEETCAALLDAGLGDPAWAQRGRIFQHVQSPKGIADALVQVLDAGNALPEHIFELFGRCGEAVAGLVGSQLVVDRLVRAGNGDRARLVALSSLARWITEADRDGLLGHLRAVAGGGDALSLARDVPVWLLACQGGRGLLREVCGEGLRRNPALAARCLSRIAREAEGKGLLRADADALVSLLAEGITVQLAEESPTTVTKLCVVIRVALEGSTRCPSPAAEMLASLALAVASRAGQFDWGVRELLGADLVPLIILPAAPPSMPEPRALEHLLALSHDPEPYVRSASLAALSAIPSARAHPQTLARMETVIEQDPVAFPRRSALEALSRLPEATLLARFRPSLIKAAADVDWEVRAICAKTLRNLQAASRTVELERALEVLKNDEDKQVKQEATGSDKDAHRSSQETKQEQDLADLLAQCAINDHPDCD
jgi:hypothetical protein